MQEEIWKDIPEYEGLYQVSNIGRVRSLDREVLYKHKKRSFNGKIRVFMVDKDGYFRLDLYKNGKCKHLYVHGLVALAFLNFKRKDAKTVIDHINDNKQDNRVENLQIVTARYNSHKTQTGYSSKYKGVHYRKDSKRWRACIVINNKKLSLGHFDNEYDAHLAYQNKLKEIENG